MCAIRTVLMTADSVGGVLTYAIELGRELTRREVRVALAVMGGPLPRPWVPDRVGGSTSGSR